MSVFGARLVISSSCIAKQNDRYGFRFMAKYPGRRLSVIGPGAPDTRPAMEDAESLDVITRSTRWSPGDFDEYLENLVF
jgi:hypothetical protein